MTRYPEKTVADLDSFRSADCNSAISDLGGEGYSSMWQSLSMDAMEAFSYFGEKLLAPPTPGAVTDNE